MLAVLFSLISLLVAAGIAQSSQLSEADSTICTMMPLNVKKRDRRVSKQRRPPSNQVFLLELELFLLTERRLI